MSIANAVNSGGTVVGLSGNGRAFSWTSGGGMVDLFGTATITGPATAVYPTGWMGAHGVNASDQIVGIARFFYPDACGSGCNITTGPHAFLYSAGVLSDLDPYLYGLDRDPLTRLSYAFGISDAGLVVGERHVPERAYSYDGSWHDLGTIGPRSGAEAVSPNGTYIAGTSPGGMSGGLFRYAAGVMTDLGIPSGHCFLMPAVTVNDSGIIALTDCTQAFHYDGTGFHQIPRLSGDTVNMATGINNSGVICGWGWPSHRPWTYEIGTATLTDLGVAKAGGGSWSWVHPRGLNASGQVVGWAK